MNPKPETHNSVVRVLLVEDNLGDADLIQEMLPKTAGNGFAVEVVQRLSEAFSRIQGAKLDIILLDLGLPDSSGLDTFIKFQAAAPDMPIIVLTGNTDQQAAVIALQQGAQDFLIKGEITGDLINRAIRYALERKRVEQKLLATEGQYRQLYERMMDAFVRVDMSRKIRECNQAFLDLLGYSQEEASGLTYLDITPGRWHAAESEILKNQVLIRGYSDVYEKEYQRKDGSIVPVELRTNLISDETGAPTGMWAIIRNISERKQAEIQLEASKDQLSLILSSMAEGIYGLDCLGNCSFCNAACVRILGYRGIHDILGKNMHELVHHVSADGSLYPREECPICMSLCSGDHFHSEHETFSRADGSHFPAECWTHPIIKDDVVLGTVVSFIDRTEQAKLENQLLQAQKMEAIGTLAGGIAHDFNNILSAIIGYGHITLMHMPKDDSQRLNIEHILESADRAAALTQSLLAFSRKQFSHKKRIDLNEVLKQVEKFAVRVIGEDVVVRVALAEPALIVLADAGQLEQVILNLATNARDAMPHGGSFTLTSTIAELDASFLVAHGYGKPGTYAMIAATDTGVGMSEDTSKKIFDPFFTTKEVGKGTGLGLAMAYGIVKQHDGFITVSSELGVGTTFRIYLPLLAEAAQEILHESAVEYPKGGTETILLAEDDEAVRKLSRIVLQEFGYTVIEAIDGEDAVAKFMQHKDSIRLLLFDLIMPKLNGKEACDVIRKVKPGMKAVFVSGYAPDIIQQKTPMDSDTHLLTKPISPTVLLGKVREALDGKNGASDPER